MCPIPYLDQDITEGKGVPSYILRYRTRGTCPILYLDQDIVRGTCIPSYILRYHRRGTYVPSRILRYHRRNVYPIPYLKISQERNVYPIPYLNQEIIVKERYPIRKRHKIHYIQTSPTGSVPHRHRIHTIRHKNKWHQQKYLTLSRVLTVTLTC